MSIMKTIVALVFVFSTHSFAGDDPNQGDLKSGVGGNFHQIGGGYLPEHFLAAPVALDPGEIGMLGAMADKMGNCSIDIRSSYPAIPEGERLDERNLGLAAVKVGCNHQAEMVFPPSPFPSAMKLKDLIASVLVNQGLVLDGPCMTSAGDGKYSKTCFLKRQDAIQPDRATRRPKLGFQ